MAKLSISILSADFLKLGEDIDLIRDGGADYIHLDAMDGRFVPNISYGQFIAHELADAYDLRQDVHIMAVEPEKQIADFISDKTEYIVVHSEAVTHLDRTLKSIRALGVKSGVALNPSSHPVTIEYALNYADQVLVMSVNPGFGGQSFIPEALDKIRSLAELRAAKGFGYEISVDGGVGEDNISTLIDAGADMLVVGSSIFNSKDKAGTMARIRELAGKRGE